MIRPMPPEPPPEVDLLLGELVLPRMPPCREHVPRPVDPEIEPSEQTVLGVGEGAEVTRIIVSDEGSANQGTAQPGTSDPLAVSRRCGTPELLLACPLWPAGRRTRGR
jgi:hypothetical protein